MDGRVTELDIAEAARRAITDGIGVLLAACTNPAVRLLVDYVVRMGGTPTCPLYGHGVASNPVQAAFVNGYAMHILDFEPMFHPPTHPVSPVLPGLLALAASHPHRAREADLLTSFVVGVELQCRLRQAAFKRDQLGARGSHFPFEARGYHPPGVVGVMGAALACTHFLGGTTEELCIALGIAASRAAGIAGNIGTMTKASHSGHAARMGVECALLATAGFTASSSILEGPAGYDEVFGGTQLDLASVSDRFSTPRVLRQPGLAYKRWPAHTAMQMAIAAGLSLYEEGAIPARVSIRGPRLPYCDRGQVQTGHAARFSFQYAVCVALLDGSVGLRSFDDTRVQDSVLQDVLARVDFIGDPEIPTSFTEMWVELALDDGRQVRVNSWPGHWRSPITDAEVDAKFRECAAVALEPGQIDDALLALHELDQVDGVHHLLQAILPR